MEEDKTRSQIEAHGDAVVRGDTATVVGDFSDKSHPQIPQIGRALQAGHRDAGSQRRVGDDHAHPFALPANTAYDRCFVGLSIIKLAPTAAMVRRHPNSTDNRLRLLARSDMNGS